MPLLSLIGSALAAQLAQAVVVPARTPMSRDSEGRTVAAMVRGIAGYARWPVAPNPIRICITGGTRLGDAWLAEEGEMRTLRRVEAGPRFPSSGCDVALIGGLSPSDMLATYSLLRGKPVLTVTDADATCRSGAMFCLASTPTTLSFSLNIDAVTRSPIRIDPRVLRLARPTA